MAEAKPRTTISYAAPGGVRICDANAFNDLSAMWWRHAGYRVNAVYAFRITMLNISLSVIMSLYFLRAGGR